MHVIYKRKTHLQCSLRQGWSLDYLRWLLKDFQVVPCGYKALFAQLYCSCFYSLLHVIVSYLIVGWVFYCRIVMIVGYNWSKQFRCWQPGEA